MNIIELIQEKYGDTCRLHSPLTKSQYSKAKKYLPKELFDILKVSNGIDEIEIINGKAEAEAIKPIIYSLAHIKEQTNAFLSECGNDGFVFAENGTGDFYVLKTNGAIYVYKYFDLKEELYAESLADYFSNATSNN